MRAESPVESPEWTYEDQFKQLYELDNDACRKPFLDELGYLYRNNTLPDVQKAFEYPTTVISFYAKSRKSSQSNSYHGKRRVGSISTLPTCCGKRWFGRSYQ